MRIRLDREQTLVQGLGVRFGFGLEQLEHREAGEIAHRNAA